MLDASIKRLKQSLANANALDAKMWVFHPGARTGISQFYPDADFKRNMRKHQRTLCSRRRIRRKHCNGEFAGVNTGF